MPDNGDWIQPARQGRNLLRPRRLLLISDLCAVGIAVVAFYLETRARNVVGAQLNVTTIYVGLTLVLTFALLMRARQYSPSRRLSVIPTVGVLTRDTVIAAAVTTLLGYLTKGFFTGLTSPSRLTMGVVVSVFYVLAVSARVGLAALQRRQYSAGRGVRRIIVAGGGKAAAELLELINSQPQQGVTVVARLRLDTPDWPCSVDATDPDTTTKDTAGLDEEADRPVGRVPLLAIPDDLEGLRQLDQLLRSSQATEVVVALDPEEQGVLPRLTMLLSLAHVPFRVVPSLFEDTYQASELLSQGEIRVVNLGVTPLDRIGSFSKRTADIATAALVMLVLIPLGFLIAFAIVLDSGWPIVFAQERVGKNGRRFTLYKFRTMSKDAEERFRELQAQNELESSDGLMFKMRKDPRVTRVGSLLRKSSLDELPQFFNVLKGDMSVVGPRPPLPREVAKYERDHLYRLRVLPGITGLWQVSGRNDLTFEDMVRLDRYYVDNWSLALDARILFRTFVVLISRKGAY